MGIRKQRNQPEAVEKEEVNEVVNEDQTPEEAKQEDIGLKEKPAEAKSEPVEEEVEYEPVLVYRSPGPHQAPGGTFEYKQICTPQDGEAALKDGWCMSVEQAVTSSKK